MSDTVFGPFAHSIYTNRYQHPQDRNWSGTSRRVAGSVMGALRPTLRFQQSKIEDATERIFKLFEARQAMPGGRYLYAAGRDLHQVNNCVLLRCPDDREGWATTSYQAEMALMTGAGIGVWYGDVRPSGSPIKRTGGVASGPIPKMQQVNETGRHTMQGGNRRSAIWAGLPWNHPDIFDFITVKDWSDEVKELKAKDWTFPAPMDMTNISVTLDDAFFEAYNDPKHASHVWATQVYEQAVAHMLRHGEPGFSVDVGKNSGEVLRNAPVVGATRVLTDEGYRPVEDVVGVPITVWTGIRWASNVVFKRTQERAETVTVQMTGGREITCDPSHPFMVERYSGAGARRKLIEVVRVPAGSLREGDIIHVSLPGSPNRAEHDRRAYTLGYAYGDGSFTGRGFEITFCTPESRQCAEHMIPHYGGNDNGQRGYMRRYYEFHSAGLTKSRVGNIPRADIPSFMAGLFDADGNVSPDGRIRLSNVSEEFLGDVARLLETVGILAHVSKNGASTYGGTQCYQLVIAADYHNQFVTAVPTVRLRPVQRGSAYRDSLVKVVSVRLDLPQDVYCADVKVEEHTFVAEGVVISNCTEITSADDSDVCNLGSLVMPRLTTPEQFGSALRDLVLFLTAGSVYSHVPYEKVAEVREMNRRLGAGLIGVHEFLMKQGTKYGTDNALEVIEPYMREYGRALEYAHEVQDALGLSLSKGATAIAPNGTIGIVAESTPSGDPMFSAAEAREVKIAGPKGDSYERHIVVDPTAKRLVAEGVNPALIEDAATLAMFPERRLRMQAFMQDYTDHAISSTVNLPAVITDPQGVRDMGETLMEFLPRLRGVTFYPDGARAGQPRSPVDLQWALNNEGTVLAVDEETCVGGACGV